MKISKDKRDKLILTCLAFIGIAGLLYTFVLGAQKDRLGVLSKQLLIARDKLSKADRLMRSKAIIEADLQTTKQTLDARQESMAPEGQYYYWFIKLMDQFREKELLNPGFIIDITQPEFIEAGLVPSIPYKAASFGLRLNGQYHDVGRFIADLENSFPYFRVQNVKMAPHTASLSGAFNARQTPLVPGGGKAGNLVVELRVVTLIRKGTT